MLKFLNVEGDQQVTRDMIVSGWLVDAPARK